MFILMKYDFWQFSKGLIVSAIGLFALLLGAFAHTTGFYQLTLISILIGAPTALFYFSSLFYGMLDAKSGSDHGGHHEAMIGTGQSIGPLISGMLIAMTGDPKAMMYWLILVLFVAALYIVAMHSFTKRLQ